MASQANTLSQEEQAKKQEMDKRSFFDNHALSLLSDTYKQAEKARRQKALEPYARQLKHYIMATLEAKKSDILASLLKPSEVPEHSFALKVPIFSYETIRWYYSYEDSERRGKLGLPYHLREQSKKEGWEWAISTVEEEVNERPYPDSLNPTEYRMVYEIYDICRREKIKDIVQKTDFLHLLAAEFGSHFEIRRYSEIFADYEEFGFGRARETLCLTYVNRGVSNTELRKRFAAMEKDKTPLKLAPRERISLWIGTDSRKKEEDLLNEKEREREREREREEEYEEERNPYARDPMCACEWCD